MKESNKCEIDDDVDSNVYFPSVKQEVLTALPVGIVGALLGLLLAYLITIHSYQHNHDIKPATIIPKRIIQSLHYQDLHRARLKHSETLLGLDGKWSILRHLNYTANAEHTQPPQIFLDGITVAIPIEDEFRSIFNSSAHADYATTLNDMYHKLSAMDCAAACIFNYAKQHVSGWKSSGLAAHFPFTGAVDGQQDRFSESVVSEMKRVARSVGASHIVVFYPHVFGEAQPGSSASEFSTLMQRIEPTRSGYLQLRSTYPVSRLALSGHDLSPSLFSDLCGRPGGQGG